MRTRQVQIGAIGALQGFVMHEIDCSDLSHHRCCDRSSRHCSCCSRWIKTQWLTHCRCCCRQLSKRRRSSHPMRLQILRRRRRQPIAVCLQRCGNRSKTASSDRLSLKTRRGREGSEICGLQRALKEGTTTQVLLVLQEKPSDGVEGCNHCHCVVKAECCEKLRQN